MASRKLEHLTDSEYRPLLDRGPLKGPGDRALQGLALAQEDT